MRNQTAMMNRGVSKNYLLNAQRSRYIDSLAYEYLSIIAVLYGDTIETGSRRVDDYGAMTMVEAENELRLRTLMYKGRRIRKQRELKEEAEKNERDMLEQLKRIS